MFDSLKLILFSASHMKSQVKMMTSWMGSHYQESNLRLLNNKIPVMLTLMHLSMKVAMKGLTLMVHGMKMVIIKMTLTIRSKI